MGPKPPGIDAARTRLVALAAVWLAVLLGCFFAVKMASPPGIRWDLWVYVPDLVDPQQRDADSGHTGWQYFPQRLDLLAVAVVILAGAWGVGHLILRIIRLPLPKACTERTVFAFGIGLAGLSLITLGVGLAGALSRPLLGSVIAGVVVIEAAFRLRLFKARLEDEARHPLPPLTKGETEDSHRSDSASVCPVRSCDALGIAASVDRL